MLAFDNKHLVFQADLCECHFLILVHDQGQILNHMNEWWKDAEQLLMKSDQNLLCELDQELVE